MNKKIATNIITGFLGVGKTTSILQLLKQKKEKDKWAVLVNEFGEIGIDGSLIKGHISDKQDVLVKEVPGGCMCCSAGLPMQAALSLLLTKVRPDRFLIEPTGIGHPVEVLNVLLENYFSKVLSIQKIITLVDARKLKDSEYTNDETFNQQISIADILVGNKSDLYNEEDKINLMAYARQKGSNHLEVLFAQNGVFPFRLLDGKTKAKSNHSHSVSLKDVDKDFSEEPIPECGFLKAINSGEGFKSVGWRFSPLKIFDHLKLITFLSGIRAIRMKAVFITSNGVFGYNLTEDALMEMELDDAVESRIEIISKEIKEYWDENLISCITDS